MPSQALPQLSFLSEYANNFAARFLSTFISGDTAATDASAFYRSQESSYGLEYVNSRPIFGGGFSAIFTDYPIVNDNSFLGLHGNAYSHNAYLWILIKTGMAGLVLFLLVLSKILLEHRKRALTYEAHLSISLLTSFLVIALIWNVLANAPDSTLFGAVIGLVLASSKSGGFIPNLKKVTSGESS